MISRERLLHIIYVPHVSEKTSFMKERCNVIVFNVNKYSTKQEIKYAVEQLFTVRVCSVSTVNIKGKIKKRGKNIGRRNDWKKAYVKLVVGEKLDVFSKVDVKP